VSADDVGDATCTRLGPAVTSNAGSTVDSVGESAVAVAVAVVAARASFAGATGCGRAATVAEGPLASPRSAGTAGAGDGVTTGGTVERGAAGPVVDAGGGSADVDAGGG
jgi:hypothetical protein